MPTPEDFINITGAPVPGVATPPSMLPPAPPVIGAPQLDIPDYSGGATPAPAAAPVAPSNWQPSGVGSMLVPEGGDAPAPGVAQPAQPAAPTQFVSRPSSHPSSAASPLDVVGTIGTGTQTSTSRVDLGQAGKDAAKAKEEADRASVGAIEQRTQYERERAAFEAEAAKAKVEAAAKYEGELEQKRQALAQQSVQHAADIQNRIADVEKEANNISGDRWWQDQSTGAKIGGMLSIALSGLGQVFQAKAGNVNTRNSALDMINMAVDRDIDAQKTRLAAKERGIKTRESAYSAARQAGADDIVATEAARAANYAQIERELDAKIKGLGDKDAIARGEALKAEIGQQRALHLTNMAKALAAQHTTQSGSRPVLAGELAANQAAQQEAEKERFRQEHGLLKKDPTLATDEGQAKSPAAFKEWTERTVAQEPAERALTVLKGTLGKSSDKLDPARRKAIGNARATIAAFLRSPAGRNTGAAMSEGEKEMLLDASLPDDTWWERAGGGLAGTIKALDADFKGNRQLWKRTYGGRTE